MNPSEPNNTETLSSKMMDVIDVLAMQREKRTSLQKSITMDYTSSSDSFTVARFIFECDKYSSKSVGSVLSAMGGSMYVKRRSTWNMIVFSVFAAFYIGGFKLDAHPLTIATAITLYHSFNRESTPKAYDPYLIASTCLYLAGKIKDDGLKIRDVMNVTSSTLHRGSQPLELDDQYWSIRDAIVQAELLIIRMLKFHVMPDHPHKYLLHYLRSLQAWFGEDEWSKYPVAKTSMALLQDFHHSPAVLDYHPNLIAIACINLTLQIYGVVVPLMDECDQLPWFNVFCTELTREKLWEIMEKIMSAYDQEPETRDNI